MAGAASDSWTGLPDALTRACSNDCATGRAILDAVGREIVAAPSAEGAWLVQKNGGELALYALADRGLSVARGICEHHEGQGATGSAAEATVIVSRMPFRGSAEIRCRVVRSERRPAPNDEHATTVMHWTLNTGDSEITFEISPESQERRKADEAEQAQKFAVAVAKALQGKAD